MVSKGCWEALLIPPLRQTCGGHLVNVDFPAKQDPGLASPTLHCGSRQGRQTEYYDQMDQSHEEGEMEALGDRKQNNYRRYNK